MAPTNFRWIALVALTAAWGCSVETLIEPSLMPNTENGVFTENGRFFVIGGSVLYEVTGGPDNFEANVVLEETCYLGGLTDHGNELFASCVDLEGGAPSELLRIDPAVPGAPTVARASFPSGSGLQLINGMDFGPDGALYVSNSGSLFSGDPAIYRVHITSDAPFAIEVEPFVDATALGTLPGQGGGLAPNGIRFKGDTMYFVRGLSIARTRLRPDGSHGPLVVVYVAGGVTVIDDFDIHGDHLIVAQINPFGVLDPKLFPSEIVAVGTNGIVEGRLSVEFLPSSTAVAPNAPFGPDAVLVTSWFNGGLYRVRRAD